MSIAEAPEPTATNLPAAPAASPGVAAPTPRRSTRFAGPAIVLLTALFILGASGWGNDLAGVTRAEIVAVLGAGALVLAALLREQRPTLPGGLPVVVFLAFAAFTALSLLWSINGAESWIEANRTIAYCAAFAGAAALAVVARDRHDAFLGGLLLGVVLVCVLALLSKVFPEWLNENERYARLREPFGYWNAVGLTGALALPGALWLGSRRHGPPALNALAYPALTLAFAAILLAYSRGSLVAGAAGALVWFVFAPQRRLRGAAIVLVAGAAAVFIAAWTFGQNALSFDKVELAARSTAGRELLVCIIAVALLTYVAGIVVGFVSDLRPLRFGERRGLGAVLLVGVALTPVLVAGVLSTTDEGLGGSISTAWKTITDPNVEAPTNDAGRLTQTGSIRARYWDDAWRMAKDRPVGGWGAGGFGTARPRYRTDTIDVEHAHGYAAQTLADLGGVGLGLSLLLVLAWGFAVRAAIRAAQGARRTALVTLTATTVVFGVHSLVDWTWFTAGTALVGLLAAGFVAGSAPRGRRAVPIPGFARYVVGGVAVLLAVAAAWSAWQPLRADTKTNDALAASDAGKVAEARALADDAHRINPLSPEPLLAKASIERVAGNIPEAQRDLEQAVDIAPAVFTTWLRLAEFQLWITDQPREALDSVRAALYLNPGSFTVVQRYLDIYRTIQNRERREAGR